MNGPTSSSVYATAPALTPDTQTGAYLLHLSPLVAFLLPSIGHLLGPLAAWLLLRQSPVLDAEGKEVVNFQLTVTLLHLALALLVFMLFSLGMLGGLVATVAPHAGIFSVFGALAGFFAVYLPLALLLSVYPFICMVLGVMKAAQGEFYRYPLTVRFIR